jgi:hypothetical protein
MKDQAIVHLSSPAAPGDRCIDRGYIERHNAIGIWINDHPYGSGPTRFYPAHLIKRIEYV